MATSAPPLALTPQAAHLTRPASACPTDNAPPTLPRDAAKNGLTLPRNSGTAQGTVNKNKMIKHQKHGRASLPSSASASCTTPRNHHHGTDARTRNLVSEYR
jgi:hypothetical protein